MEARRLRRLVPVLVVLALFGLSDTNADRDRGGVDGAARISAERAGGADTALAPTRGGRIDADRGREARPVDLAPVAIGPAGPATAAGQRGWRTVVAPDERWSASARAGSSRPRAPPVV